ncbi:MAG: Ig-like domain-containing protein [Candidatus Aminicenantes bacterium]|jgi:tetratricopeptide (TPR) repeat protein
MPRGTGLKRTSALVLFLFTWFIFAARFQMARAQDNAGDKLTQGIEYYETGDYGKSINLLEDYIATLQNPREKRAEAYYFLAKNYYAVNPDKVKEALTKTFETDWFFTFEEKDAYFKKMVEDLRREFMETIPVEKYLKQAESNFEKGKYDEAKYLYRVIAQKLPAKTIAQQIEKCDEAKQKKQEALDLYRQKKYEQAYRALRPLLKISPGDDQLKTAATWIETRKIVPLIEAAESYFKNKNYKDAAHFFEWILTFMPDDAKIQEKLTICQEILGIEISPGKTIEKEGVRKQGKKKKFPVLLVVLGTAAVGVALYLLLKKKKEPAPTTGSIKVESSPEAARIWLNETDTGQTTPAVLTGIQPGSHSIKLTKEGYLDYQVTVTVEAGKETLLFAPLTPAPTPNFVTTSDTVIVPEGGQSTFQVKLSERPLNDVSAQVRRISGDTDITISSGENLTFTGSNWDTYQTVTLNAAEDSDDENGDAIFRISASGIPDKDILAVEQDRGGPGYLTVTPADDFSSAGVLGGPFSPNSKTYILENTGTGSINWTASKIADWITLSATSGNLEIGTSTAVTVSINNNANFLPVGTYNDTITFLNTTNGSGSTTRNVTLLIESPDTPPTVTITNPTDGQTVSGTITIQVDASDDNGISKVEIYIDNVLTATLTVVPYTYQWNTTTAANGSHTIKATAYDTADQTTDDQVSVNVNNSNQI